LRTPSNTVEHLAKNGHSAEGFLTVKTELVGRIPQESSYQTEPAMLENKNLIERLEADMAFSIAYSEASPHAKETLQILRNLR
jgi:hypothetical protein